MVLCYVGQFRKRNVRFVSVHELVPTIIRRLATTGKTVPHMPRKIRLDSILLQQLQHLLETTRAGWANAAFGGPKSRSYFSVRRRLRLIIEHSQELLASFIQRKKRLPNSVLFFQPSEHF